MSSITRPSYICDESYTVKADKFFFPFDEHRILSGEELLEYLASKNPQLINGKLILDDLDIVTRDRLRLASKEKVIVESGRDKDKDGKVNAVHINPNYDTHGNPVLQYVPFIKRTPKPVVNRPVRHGFKKKCGCGRC